VMCDEIMAMTRRVMRGIEVSDDTLMLDVIDRVGPSGEFMSTRETAKRCRSELWNPRLADRLPWASWEAGGREGMSERAKARVRAILAEHHPIPLPDGAAAQVAAILAQAEARESARGER
jgi:trimethylamine---corrinoid protein Co-methyltransferase